jgi:hypothetical protein
MTTMGEHIKRVDRRLAEKVNEIYAERDRLKAINAELVEALLAAKRMCEQALPKFNWGASFLDAHSITLLNETPAIIDAALKKAAP